jgi:hypothetical protein
LETLLSYGPAAKDSQLTGVVWYKDTPGFMNSREKEENKGFGERLALIAESKPVQMIGKLHLDLFCQEKCQLNQVEMKIKLRRSRDVFAQVSSLRVHAGGRGYEFFVETDAYVAK